MDEIVNEFEASWKQILLRFIVLLIAVFLLLFGTFMYLIDSFEYVIFYLFAVIMLYLLAFCLPRKITITDSVLVFGTVLAPICIEFKDVLSVSDVTSEQSRTISRTTGKSPVVYIQVRIKNRFRIIFIGRDFTNFEKLYGILNAIKPSPSDNK